MVAVEYAALRAAPVECTLESHAATKRLGVRALRNARYWPEADAHLGECPVCSSTLMIPVDIVDEA